MIRLARCICRTRDKKPTKFVFCIDFFDFISLLRQGISTAPMLSVSSPLGSVLSSTICGLRDSLFCSSSSISFGSAINMKNNVYKIPIAQKTHYSLEDSVNELFFLTHGATQWRKLILSDTQNSGSTIGEEVI